MEKMRSLMTRADKILIMAVLLFAFAGLAARLYVAPPEGIKAAQIYVNGELIKTFALRPGYHQIFRIGGERQYDIIEVNDARVRVLEADCPTQECVQAGWISTPPQQIVCLPDRIVIKVVADKADIDLIVR